MKVIMWMANHMALDTLFVPTEGIIMANGWREENMAREGCNTRNHLQRSPMMVNGFKENQLGMVSFHSTSWYNGPYENGKRHGKGTFFDHNTGEETEVEYFQGGKVHNSN
eukprot:m.12521 g.12521  ORF g.12521 m.12521 type:complete len:110 (-) comp7233_c0_seq1:142-471(-)